MQRAIASHRRWPWSRKMGHRPAAERRGGGQPGVLLLRLLSQELASVSVSGVSLWSLSASQHGQSVLHSAHVHSIPLRGLQRMLGGWGRWILKRKTTFSVLLTFYEAVCPQMIARGMIVTKKYNFNKTKFLEFLGARQDVEMASPTDDTNGPQWQA